MLLKAVTGTLASWAGEGGSLLLEAISHLFPSTSCRKRCFLLRRDSVVPRWGGEVPWLSAVPHLGSPAGAIVLPPVLSQNFRIHTKPHEMSHLNTNVFRSGIPISINFNHLI